MKSELFKKLIKQCVKEAMREELPIVLLEYQQRQKSNLNEITFTSDSVLPQTVKKDIANKMLNLFEDTPAPTVNNVETEVKNPYLAFIQDAANNMSPQERSGLKNL